MTVANGILDRDALAYLGGALPRGRRVASIGDSRVEHGQATGTTTGRNWRFFLHPANALMGSRLVDVGNFGVSGERTDQVLARIDTALATSPDFLIIWCGVNDFLQSYTDDVGAWANIKAMADKAISRGVRPIHVTEAGSTTFAADAAKRGYCYGLNQRMAEYVDSNPLALLFDEAGVSLNPTNATLGFRSNYSADGTHCTTLRGYMGGKALAALLSPLVPPVNRLPNVVGNTFTANARQVLDNGLITTTTGGTLSTNASGTVPQNFTAFGSTTGAVTVGSTANTDGFGNDVTLAMTGNANDSCWLRNGLTTSRFAAGDIVQGVCEVTVSSPANIQGISLALDLTVGGQAYSYYDGYSTSGGGGPAEGFTATLATPPFVVPAGSVTASVLRLQAGFSAASGAVNLAARRWAVRKLLAAQ